MVLSNKTQIALLFIYYLVQKEGSTVSLKEVSDRFGFSVSHLEQIAAKLRKACLVESVRGPGGGYQVPKHAMERSVQEVIDCFVTKRALYYCNNSETRASINAKNDLASLDGYIFRHLNGLTIKESLELM